MHVFQSPFVLECIFLTSYDYWLQQVGLLRLAKSVVIAPVFVPVVLAGWQWCRQPCFCSLAWHPWPWPKSNWWCSSPLYCTEPPECNGGRHVCTSNKTTRFASDDHHQQQNDHLHQEFPTGTTASISVQPTTETETDVCCRVAGSFCRATLKC